MSNPADLLVGLWVSAEGAWQFRADGYMIVSGQMFGYKADGSILTLTGAQGSGQLPYRLEGDTLTYVSNGQTYSARRFSQAALVDLAQALRRGAGEWVGNESSLDPGLYISWTQYVTLNPDGTMDYRRNDSGAQVSNYSGNFFFSREAGPSQPHAGRWSSDGVNITVQWNNGQVWQGQIDIGGGKLVFYGIGNLNPGSNLLFERQPFPFNIEELVASGSAQGAPIPPIPAPVSPAFGYSTGAQMQSGAEDPLAKLFAALKELQTSGRLDPAVSDQLAALIDDPRQLAMLTSNPQLMADLEQRLTDAGAGEVGSGAPLEIADYYREGPGKFALLWPLDASQTLPVPFDQLVRKSQFLSCFPSGPCARCKGCRCLTAVRWIKLSRSSRNAWRAPHRLTWRSYRRAATRG